MTLKVFSDADFAGDIRMRQSKRGVVSVCAGSIIAWSSQLQQSVAPSTMEAEFIADSEEAKELLWLKCLLGELGENFSELSTLYVDNARAVKLMKEVS